MPASIVDILMDDLVNVEIGMEYPDASCLDLHFDILEIRNELWESNNRKPTVKELHERLTPDLISRIDSLRGGIPWEKVFNLSQPAEPNGEA